jgi:uncharacterized protein (DUF1499 family)
MERLKLSNEIKCRLFGIPVTEEEYNFVAAEFKQRLLDMVTAQLDADISGIMKAVETINADRMVEQKMGINKRIEFSANDIRYVMARCKLYSERGTLGAARELLEK